MLRMPVLGPVALVLGMMLLAAPPAGAKATSSSRLPRSDYTARAVCATPTPAHAACQAVALEPLTAQARAHTHPLAIARSQRHEATARHSAVGGEFGLRPQDLHSAYRLPTDAPSTQTIALVDVYNDLTAEEDLESYSQEFGLPQCTESNGCFEKVNQDGETTDLPFPKTAAELEAARNGTKAQREAAGNAPGWALEISLDIETAHAVCQNCRILLVEANSASYANLEAAEDAATSLHANEISDSWAGPECASGSCVESSSAFDHPGTVIAAAAGDDGYLDWLEEPRSGSASFPASSPQVVAVGGTRLSVGPEGEWAGESVWNDGGESKGRPDGHGASGGGCSARFTAQPWQQAVADWSTVGCGDKRGVADVAADADPYSGLAVYDTSPECESLYEEEDGELQDVHWCTIGGTSLATPMIASTFALAGGAGGVAFPARTLYEAESRTPAALHDVSEGSNAECAKPFDSATGLPACSSSQEAQAGCAGQAICLAGAGYDGPTGVGTPDGIAAFEALPSPPTVTTGSASAISQRQATLEASVDPNGEEVSACTFEYGTTTAYGSSAPCTPTPSSGTGSVAVSAAITGLTAGTPYHFRVVATNAGGTSEGSDRTFTTFAAGTPPTITLEPASKITQSDATLTAQIDPEGLETEYEIRVADPCPAPLECIRDVDVPGQKEIPASSTEESVSVDLAEADGNLDLEPDTTYKYWVRARNLAGETESAQQTFTTLPVAPAITATTATSITQGSATLEASVDPNGASVTQCTLEYGTSTAYESSLPCTPAPGSGNTAVKVSASPSGLAAGTTYHFRFVASNAGGVGEGADETFTTKLATALQAQIPGGQTQSSGSSGSTSPSGSVLASKQAKTPPLPIAELASAALLASASGTITVEVSCPASVIKCTGTVTLRTLKAGVSAGSSGSSAEKASIVTLAVGTFKAAGGHDAVVRLALSKAGRALLARVRVLRVRATILARDLAGATYTTLRIVTIRPASAANIHAA
jgi:hypothetical protein